MSNPYGFAPNMSMREYAGDPGLDETPTLADVTCPHCGVMGFLTYDVEDDGRYGRLIIYCGAVGCGKTVEREVA